MADWPIHPGEATAQQMRRLPFRKDGGMPAALIATKRLPAVVDHAGMALKV